MEDMEIRRYEMFIRVREFGVANASSFSPNSLAGELFATINSIVDELSGHAIKQTFSDRTAREGTANKASLRDELREEMLAISHTARIMKIDQPGFENRFRLPRNLADKALITLAHTFAENVAPLVSEFVRHELPANFLEDLNNTIKLFEKAANDQNHGTENRVIASAAIDGAIEHGMETVRRLDTVVKNRFSNDPAILAAWARAKHTERSPRPAPAEEIPQTTATNK